MNNFFNLINSNISILEKQKKILLQYVLKISDCPTTSLSTDSSDELIEFLSHLKEKITITDENISIAHDFLNKIKEMNNLEFSNTIFDEYSNISSTIFSCILDIQDFLINSMDFINLNFDVQVSSKTESDSENLSVLDNDINENNLQISDAQCNNFLENTLVISETQGKVILPYTINELNLILEEKNSKYQNINEIIEDNFVIPYANFKNPIFSRFKEAFKLIRYKEHGSIKEAFDLGMELLLNYNLHPAIISACKNIDELDIYLDYLENNETDKFDCFNIKFEITPTLIK